MKIDKEILPQIFELLETLIEAAEYVKQCFMKEENINAETMMQEMKGVLIQIQEYLTQDHEEDHFLKIACKCIVYSLENIIKSYSVDRDRGIRRIGYELIPFIKNTQRTLFLRTNIEQHDIKNLIDENFIEKYYEHEVMEGIKNKDYKYELSIIVYAYDKLEYTKLCVENILKYVPKNIEYELILVNHGSSDDTKAYFESVNPTKQIDVLINKAVVVNELYAEGKYLLQVSNDVIITKNSIENMIKCMESDRKIAKIVPSTTNVSNLQVPEDLESFSNLIKMHEIAEKNNQYSDFRHEERTRLCDPIALYRLEQIRDIEYIRFVQSNILQDMFMFPDDILSLYLRRSGYKQMLAKDSFCYHFGSITLEDELSKQNKEAFYLNGRKMFYKKFGIDPWGKGFCWDYQLKDFFEQCYDKGTVNVLGINCGIGSNALKLKESIKANSKNHDVMLYNISEEKQYAQDLRGISDNYKAIKTFGELDLVYRNVKFNYIIVEEGIELQKSQMRGVEQCRKKLASKGILLAKILNGELRKKIETYYQGKTYIMGDWVIINS